MFLLLLTSLYHSFRGDLERDWLRVTEESSKARGEISAQAELPAQFREKSEELKAWITEIRTKVSEFDPNDIETPATLSNDIQAIRVSNYVCLPRHSKSEGFELFFRIYKYIPLVLKYACLKHPSHI